MGSLLCGYGCSLLCGYGCLICGYVDTYVLTYGRQSQGLFLSHVWVLHGGNSCIYRADKVLF